jgi:electron transfer flavoprotein alpha subunit
VSHLKSGRILATDQDCLCGRVSGTFQHYAGMKEGKVIAEINNDSEAPIF